ncbi:MAG: hypothetical protein D6B25_07160 [Desulfobulbaceae bacterium]|nr:MAG: hypothetical protein D6B25_07160 [Desulfobulbaceae bacterium]
MKTLLEASRRTRTETDIEHGLFNVIFNIAAAFAILIGIWAVACLVSGFASQGPLAMFRGYLSAVTGF